MHGIILKNVSKKKWNFNQSFDVKRLSQLYSCILAKNNNQYTIQIHKFQTKIIWHHKQYFILFNKKVILKMHVSVYGIYK